MAGPSTLALSAPMTSRQTRRSPAEQGRLQRYMTAKRVKVAHPSLRVVREDANGVVISGMKMLATAAVYADEIWIGNLQPLEASRLAESITCAIPIAMSGLSLWARQPYALHVRDPLDYP